MAMVGAEVEARAEETGQPVLGVEGRTGVQTEHQMESQRILAEVAVEIQSRERWERRL